VLLLVGSVLGVPWLLTELGGTGTDFPPPVENVSVYDPAGALAADVEAQLEQRIDAIEGRSGAEIAIYSRFAPDVTNESNLADARRLMDEWGIGRRGFDDGFVILVSFRTSSYQSAGSFSTYAGSGFLARHTRLGRCLGHRAGAAPRGGRGAGADAGRPS
jgi:uncharacterized membrane protein YgcG